MISSVKTHPLALIRLRLFITALRSDSLMSVSVSFSFSLSQFLCPCIFLFVPVSLPPSLSPPTPQPAPLILLCWKCIDLDRHKENIHSHFAVSYFGETAVTLRIS